MLLHRHYCVGTVLVLLSQVYPDDSSRVSSDVDMLQLSLVHSNTAVVVYGMLSSDDLLSYAG